MISHIVLGWCKSKARSWQKTKERQTTQFHSTLFMNCVQTLGFAVLIAGCTTSTVTNLPSETAVPAVLPIASAAKKLEIQRALGVLVYGTFDANKKILILDDALTKTSVLTLEKKARSDRELGFPALETFRLLLDNGQCFLHYENKNTYELLDNAECLPATSLN